jgi:hypothetical protein
MTIGANGDPAFQRSDTPIEGSVYSVEVTKVGSEYQIGDPVQLIATYLPSSNPQGVRATPRPLRVNPPQLFQFGKELLLALSSNDPEFAGYRVYYSYDGGKSFARRNNTEAGLFPLFHYDSDLPGLVKLGGGIVTWVDYYTYLGLPQSEIDKIPEVFRYQLVDQSYVWGSAVTGVLVNDLPSHADPDTSNDVVVDTSESNGVLSDPSTAGGICRLEVPVSPLPPADGSPYG